MAKRQKNQVFLAWDVEGGGEAPENARRGTEAVTAEPSTESPAATRLMARLLRLLRNAQRDAESG